MASLFIKHAGTAKRVELLANHLRTTKTDTVQQALDALEEKIGFQHPAASLIERLDAWRVAHPLPPSTGQVPDKAFFDEMWGEETDV